MPPRPPAYESPYYLLSNSHLHLLLAARRRLDIGIWLSQTLLAKNVRIPSVAHLRRHAHRGSLIAKFIQLRLGETLLPEDVRLEPPR